MRSPRGFHGVNLQRLTMAFRFLPPNTESRSSSSSEGLPHVSRNVIGTHVEPSFLELLALGRCQSCFSFCPKFQCRILGHFSLKCLPPPKMQKPCQHNWQLPHWHPKTWRAISARPYLLRSLLRAPPRPSCRACQVERLRLFERRQVLNVAAHIEFESRR